MLSSVACLLGRAFHTDQQLLLIKIKSKVIPYPRKNIYFLFRLSALKFQQFMRSRSQLFTQAFLPLSEITFVPGTNML